MATTTTRDLERSAYHGRHMSLAEFEALPEETAVPRIYRDGVVVQKAVANWMHGAVAAILAAALVGNMRSHRGAVSVEERVRIGASRLLPDVAYWAPDKPHLQGNSRCPPRSRSRSVPRTKRCKSSAISAGACAPTAWTSAG